MTPASCPPGCSLPDVRTRPVAGGQEGSRPLPVMLVEALPRMRAEVRADAPLGVLVEARWARLAQRRRRGPAGGPEMTIDRAVECPSGEPGRPTVIRVPERYKGSGHLRGTPLAFRIVTLRAPRSKLVLKQVVQLPSSTHLHPPEPVVIDPSTGNLVSVRDVGWVEERWYPYQGGGHGTLGTRAEVA